MRKFYLIAIVWLLVAAFAFAQSKSTHISSPPGTSTSSSSGGGISPCTVSANGDLYCPGDGGFTGGVLLNQHAGSVYPELQGLVWRVPAGNVGWQLVDNGGTLELSVEQNSPVEGAISQSWAANGTVTINDLGFGSGQFNVGLISRFSNTENTGRLSVANGTPATITVRSTAVCLVTPEDNSKNITYGVSSSTLTITMVSTGSVFVNYHCF